MKKTSLYILIIVIIAGTLNTLGITWGLPNPSHIYVYNDDETTYLRILNNMNPSRLDFDPKLYWKTHLSIYYTGAVLKAGELLGLYEIGTKGYYKQNPGELKNIILWQRIFWGKIPLIFLIIVSFLVGRQLLDDKFGILMAGIVGFLPTIIVNGNYAVENIFLTVLVALVLYFSLKFYQSGNLTHIILASLAVGLALSTKQTGILSSIFLLAAILRKRKEMGASKIIKYLIISGLFIALAFTFTSPYYVKFLVLRVFSPNKIRPDLYGSTNIPTDIFKFSPGYFIWNIVRIFKTNFIQLGGILFLFIPVGMYLKRKDRKFKIVLSYIVIFYLISFFTKYSSDARLMPLAYFLTILGSSGVYCLITASKSNLHKGIIGSLLVLSLFIYAGIIGFRYFKQDNRRISSQWIKTNILMDNENVSIGLHESPGYDSPDIITMEWRHNSPGNDEYYPNDYKETFVIPEHELREFGGQQIVPDKELTSEMDRMKWLESKSPDYIVLSSNLGKWPSYFDESQKYKLVKFFPRYNVLGISNLTLYSFDVYIYKRNPL